MNHNAEHYSGVISIRLTDDLLDQLQKLAKRERRNRSNMIEYLLREKLLEMGRISP